MARFNRARSFGRRSSPNRAWAGAVDVESTIVGPSTKTLLGSLVLSNTNIDETVLRTVGMISVKTDNVAADEQQIGAFGMIVVNDLALAAGAASIPGPVTDIGDDGWFVHVPFNSSFLFGDTSAIQHNINTSHMFDFKSKRIVQDGFGIALMVETAAGSEGAVFGVILRMLSMVKGT